MLLPHITKSKTSCSSTQVIAVYHCLVARLLADPQASGQAMRLTWVAHNLERVVFSLTGSLVEMTDDSSLRRPQA